MKKTYTKTVIPALLFLFGCALIGLSGCEKEKESSDTFIEGTVISLVSPCQGNGVLISVDNIPNFGETGLFYYNSIDSVVNYQNAILVPHFTASIEGSDLITPPISAGNKLKFECRVATEADYLLFAYEHPCTMNTMPVSAPRYVITKIINYQNQ
jgi:hypothetical protein